MPCVATSNTTGPSHFVHRLHGRRHCHAAGMSKVCTKCAHALGSLSEAHVHWVPHDRRHSTLVNVHDHVVKDLPTNKCYGLACVALFFVMSGYYTSANKIQSSLMARLGRGHGVMSPYSTDRAAV